MAERSDGGRLQRVGRWLFESRETGEIVVGQPPNLALWVWIVATVAGWLAPDGSDVARAAPVLATVALAWWAVDEVVRGVNPFRRALGVVVTAVVVASVL